MKLRSHQKELEAVLRNLNESELPHDVLVDVVPGGGKSMLPGLLAKRFPHHRIAWYVPRLSLARQAAIGMQKHFGIEIRESGNHTDPSRGTRGFVATHAALTSAPDLWRHELSRHPYLLVIDELHHAKLSRSGEPNALANAIADLNYTVRLCMTGTLETNDNSLIYNVPYAGTARGYELDLQSFAGKVIRYSRSSALGQGAIVPVEFHYHDGPVKWEDREGIQEARLSQVGSEDEAQAVWTALRTELADQLLANTIAHWRKFGRKLLVVCADQQTSKAYHASISRQGILCGLAISDAADAHSDIDEFREGRIECLVTCQMAYEGLDVPDITHIACLTHIRSVPWILQMLARAWRAMPGKKQCWAFVPNDPRMNRVIEKIRREQEVVVPLLQQKNGQGGSTQDFAFVPISGEVLSVTAEMLDDGQVKDPILEQVAALCDQYNLPMNSPSAAEFISALRSGITLSKRAKTVIDKETEQRNHIAETCRKADNAKGLPFGTHQARLFHHTGKRMENMKLEELENARTICAHICS